VSILLFALVSFQPNYINQKPDYYVKNIIIHEAEKKCDELYMNLHQILVDEFK